jgi:hypothetical protein
MEYLKPELSASYLVTDLYNGVRGFFSAGGVVGGDNPCDFGPGKDTGRLNDNPGGSCGPH